MEKTPLQRIFVLLKNQKSWVALLLVFILISSGLDIVVPFILRNLIDRLTDSISGIATLDTTALGLTAGLILLVTALAYLFITLYEYFLFQHVTKIEDDIRTFAFEKYLRLHALFHHGASSGQIIGRIERGAAAIFTILNDVIGHNLIQPLIIVIGVTIVVAIKSPVMALITFIPVPLYVVVVRHYSQKIYEIEQRSSDAFENVAKEEYDVASNVLTVKKFSQEKVETAHQRALLNAAREIEYTGERLWKIMENFQTFIAAAGRIAVIFAAAWFTLKNQFTIGEFVLFVTLQNMAYAPLGRVSNVLPRLRRNLARAERLFRIIDEPVHITDKPNAIRLKPMAKELIFENVSFAYQSKKRPALKNLNLTIAAGTTVALVGRSGSGKTTFINLLLRSFDPTSGSIKIDGHDLRDVTQESLRSQIAVVPQEVDLFSRTVKENISYGKPRVTQAAIEQAAKTALAHDFILKLDEGYNTVVGERGIKLSGGERQRVGIARAVLRDPKILILDEATSHLDTESERLIQKATDSLIQNRTSFIIAHRLSTVIHADRILVFANGSIEATGTHEELLKTSPTYQRLHDLQFAE